MKAMYKRERTRAVYFRLLFFFPAAFLPEGLPEEATDSLSLRLAVPFAGEAGTASLARGDGVLGMMGLGLLSGIGPLLPYFDSVS